MRLRSQGKDRGQNGLDATPGGNCRRKGSDGLASARIHGELYERCEAAVSRRTGSPRLRHEEGVVAGSPSGAFEDRFCCSPVFRRKCSQVCVVVTYQLRKQLFIFKNTNDYGDPHGTVVNDSSDPDSLQGANGLFV